MIVGNNIKFLTNDLSFKKSTDNFIFLEKDKIFELYKPTENVDLSKIKVVYFDKTSDFPKNKLSIFTNIKRCIKLEKADVVVIGKPKYAKCYRYSSYVFYSKKEDTHYICPTFIINNKVCNISSNTTKDVADKLISLTLIPNDCFFLSKQYQSVTNDLFSSIKLLTENKDLIFITDDQLNSLMITGMENIDYSTIESIDDFLKSSDSSSVELGMNLLSNYNISHLLCTVALLILKRGNNIWKTRSVDSVSFKQLLSQLKIEKNDLIRNSPEYLLNKLIELSKISTGEDDRQFAREYVKSIILDHIVSFSERYDRFKKEFKIDINISIN